ncbi:hypothetical protein A2U01_0040602, partial [Trifolium medium]|nr:hypothetical protein [Trifolium medium]
MELGLEPTPGEKLLIGANFASARIAILNHTEFHF